jgi:glycosyltransferase involved in cell wall biosynthesis
VARIALVHDVAGVAAIQAELLRSAGHEVDQIALPAIGATWKWPAKAIALPVRLAAYLPTIARLRNAKYDIVHIHWLSHGIVGVLARRPFFSQAHGSDLHVNLNNPMYRWVNRAVLNHAKKIFYVTPNLRSYLKDYEDKVLYLPNPVYMPELSRQIAPPTQVSRVLIFTRLDPIKGVDLIFPAVERLSQVVHVTAIDWGPLARDYVGKYGRWVHFVKPVPRASVGAFLQQFDVVIGQMRQGSLGLSEIEALAAGRPLVTGIDWSLYPEDPPPVIAASGDEAVVSAVERLRNAPDRLTEISRNGREWAYRNHSFDHHLQLLEAAYFGAQGHQPVMNRRESAPGTI